MVKQKKQLTMKKNFSILMVTAILMMAFGSCKLFERQPIEKTWYEISMDAYSEDCFKYNTWGYAEQKWYEEKEICKDLFINQTVNWNDTFQVVLKAGTENVWYEITNRTTGEILEIGIIPAYQNKTVQIKIEE
jgi:hypothetical protein